MLSFAIRSIPNALIYIIAAAILAGSLLYSRYLATQLEEKERQTIELKVRAINIQGNTRPDLTPSSFEQAAQTFIFDIIKEEDDKVPWILTSEQFEFSSGINLSREDSLLTEKDKKELINTFREEHEPIKIVIGDESLNITQFVLYGESKLLKQLRWFPVAQMIVAFTFIGIVFAGFAVAKRNEQNKVWVGLAKETAHQLGTPVSSLMAWTELLKTNLEDRPEDQEFVREMEQDVKRLEDITERFSKIGSEPELLPVSVREVLDRSAQYLKKRMTRKGNVTVHVQNDLPAEATLQINPQLFNWVIENLCKNALDAIQDQKGSITINARENEQAFTIDVSDTGKGIPKSNFKKVFEPGFTTKKRGWGLGLSLTKRIVENYHKGKIYVKTSEVGKGTTFRIVLPK